MTLLLNPASVLARWSPFAKEHASHTPTDYRRRTFCHWACPCVTCKGGDRPSMMYGHTRVLTGLGMQCGHTEVLAYLVRQCGHIRVTGWICCMDSASRSLALFSQNPGLS